MNSRIRILPPELVNQIAAGEVVERPASVVKELVENSLDAGARTIRCRVEEGGQRLIQVMDDGEGMSREDLLLAVERHATSKIATADDLNRILTLGFRGEALPSIASVSRLRIVTRRKGTDSGFRLEMEGSQVPRIAEIGAPVGTTIEVADLFFNTPARKKFLSKPTTETMHVQTWMTRLALVRADVHIRLDSEKRTLLDAPPASDFPQRAAILLGREVFEHLHALSYQEENLVISGLVSSPEHSRTNTHAIFLFVNGRFVRDRLLQHAVIEGYQNLLPAGRFPVVILKLEVDPASVDVNVHPQKIEVRFQDSNRMHRAVKVAVAEVLASSPWTKSVRNYILSDSGAQQRKSAPTGIDHGIQEAIRPYLSGYQRLRTGNQELSIQELGSIPRHLGDVPLGPWRILGTLWDTYLFLASEEKVIVIDQHAAHERITYENLRRSVETDGVRSQRLLVPLLLELDGSELAAMENYREHLEGFGLGIEPFGANTIKVTAIPALLSNAPVAPLVRDVLDELLENEDSDSWEHKRLGVIGRMACHASVRAGQSLSQSEIWALFSQLQVVDFASLCPHGRPVVVEFSKTEVEHWFQRG